MLKSVKSTVVDWVRRLFRRRHRPEPARLGSSTKPNSPAHPLSAAASDHPAKPPSFNSNQSTIELPLGSVVAALPPELSAKLITQPNDSQTIELSAELVISQLPYGAVRISFGELRQLASGIFANVSSPLDNKLVSLPLQEILPRLNLAMLARRSAKKVEVSQEIVGPFAERGRGFSFTTQPLKGSVAPVAAQPLTPAPAPAAPPVPEAPAPAAQPPILPLPAPSLKSVPVPPPTPLPAPHSLSPRSTTPAAPAQPTNGAHGLGAAHPLPVSPLSPRSIAPPGLGGLGNSPANGHANGNSNGHPAGGANGSANGHSHGNGNGNGTSLPPGLRLGSMNGHGRSEAPKPMKLASEPVSASAHSPGPERLEPTPPTIFASLNQLCEKWPAAIKQEILDSALADISVPLDGAIIMPGLKRGRVTMVWKQLRQLAKPGAAPSPDDQVELELPLKVIAPLFLAAQKNPRPQGKATVSAEIPDLFFGFPQPPAAPAAPAAPAVSLPPLAMAVPPAPAETPRAASAPAQHRPQEAKAQDTNFYEWSAKGEAPPAEDLSARPVAVAHTDFLNRQTHPKDLVARALVLPGVAGAVVALQDGLRVASEVPADLNADTLAAFLPQIFERVNQSTRELRMGALNNINFTVGNVPWKIFRVNAVYFAAFGQAGQPLPSAQLAQLAAQLDRKKTL
jgi:predicted regulator of Ras-like GTPase activity (Roadblock/LC7/MglB family)